METVKAELQEEGALKADSASEAKIASLREERQSSAFLEVSACIVSCTQPCSASAKHAVSIGYRQMVASFILHR